MPRTIQIMMAAFKINPSIMMIHSTADRVDLVNSSYGSGAKFSGDKAAKPRRHLSAPITGYRINRYRIQVKLTNILENSEAIFWQ